MNEPVAWKVIETDDEGSFTTFTENEPVWASNAIPLYTHPVDAVNISEQYVDKSENNRHDLGIAEAIGFEKGYAAAQAKTLTDSEIQEIIKQQDWFSMSWVDMVRRIEDKIRNG